MSDSPTCPKCGGVGRSGADALCSDPAHPDDAPIPTDADPTTGEVFDHAGYDKATQQVVTLDGALYFARLARDARELVEAMEKDGKEEAARLQAKLAEVKARTLRLTERQQARVDWLEGKLQDFADRNREALMRGRPARAKSVTFPSGLSFAWRKVPQRLRALDTPEAEARLLEWARGRDAEGLISEEVNWLGVTRCVGKDEPAPPGTEWVPESERLAVNVGSGPNGGTQP